MPAIRILVIDNYDSFTYNLCQLIAGVSGVEPTIIRNNELTWSELQDLTFDGVVISPGPGRPDVERDFGICGEVLSRLNVPILGVCLGHQGLAHVHGGRIVHAPEPMHGRLSAIHHDNSALFSGIPDGFIAVRYHSLVVAEPLPPLLTKTAWTGDGLVMGLRADGRDHWGVQFHPESICTEFGRQLLCNFLDIAAERKRSAPPHSRARCDVVVDRTASGQILHARSSTGSERYEVRCRTINRMFDAESVFGNLFAADPVSFWLDSSMVQQGAGRFTAMGSGIGRAGCLVRYHAASRILTIVDGNGREERREQSIFDYLAEEIERRKCEVTDLEFDFNCGFVGYFGYELKWECGNRVRPPDSIVTDSRSKAPVHSAAAPDAMFLLADRLIVFDHLTATTHLLSLIRTGEEKIAVSWFDETEQRLRSLVPLGRSESRPMAPPAFCLARDRDTYLSQIRECLRFISDGESYEICLTNKLRARSNADAFALYRELRRLNPAPYSAFLKFPDVSILCSSPERFLRIGRDRWMESKPIKGTRARGSTREEDEALCRDLKLSVKDRAENLMIVDLVRHDLGRVCATGTVSVPSLMQVQSYATVHQLVSTVRGLLAPQLSTIDAVRSAFPPGSMTGAPKSRTMEILESLEREPRGVYSGSVGYLSLNGAADLNVVIRTMVLQNGEISIGVGGAIVALSDPEQEFDETLLKGRVLIRAARGCAPQLDEPLTVGAVHGDERHL
jgi:para-aminobenzoate synthetase